MRSLSSGRAISDLACLRIAAARPVVGVQLQGSLCLLDLPFRILSTEPTQEVGQGLIVDRLPLRNTSVFAYPEVVHSAKRFLNPVVLDQKICERLHNSPVFCIRRPLHNKTWEIVMLLAGEKPPRPRAA